MLAITERGRHAIHDVQIPILCALATLISVDIWLYSPVCMILQIQTDRVNIAVKCTSRTVITLNGAD